MGFMDKAKRFADQAQAKLDEVQKQAGDRSGTTPAPSGPAIEYDQHGRRITPVAPTDPEPPHGDPLAAAPPAPAEKSPALQPEPEDRERPHGDPLLDQAAPERRPPGGGGLTSGDPLAG